MTYLPSQTGGGGGGALVLLDAQVFSNVATADFYTGFDDTYNEYELHYGLIPATNAVELRLRVGANPPSTWRQGSFDYMWHHNRSSSSSSAAFTQSANSGANNHVRLATAVTSTASGGFGIQGTVRVLRMRDSSYKTTLLANATAFEVPGTTQIHQHEVIAGVWTQLPPHNGLRLFFSSGNVAAGWGRVYGIPQS